MLDEWGEFVRDSHTQKKNGVQFYWEGGWWLWVVTIATADHCNIAPNDALMTMTSLCLCAKEFDC